MLLRELARHSAALELVEDAELSVLRYGCLSSSALLLPPEGQEEDVCLASAVTSDAAERVTRYRRAHEKGFHAALQRFLDLRTNQQARKPMRMKEEGLHFTDERACAAWLRKRLLHVDHRCAACGHAHGHWLADRQRWECARCGRQMGLRAGTLMERSQFPLVLWFKAIAALRANPSICATELATALGVARLATVRSIMQRIRSALESPHRSSLLAGLDQLLDNPGVT